MIKKLSGLLLTTLLVMPWLNGQEPGEAKKDPSGRKAWIVATTVTKDMANPLPVLSGEKLHHVKLHLRSVGRPIPIEKSGIVRAVKPIMDEQGKTSYVNLSYSQVPEGVREALIVLVPSKKKTDGLLFNSKVIDLGKFKKGGCLYINLTSTRLGVTIGKQRTVINSGGMEIINPPVQERVEVMPVAFFYEAPTDNKKEWKLMTSSKMAIFKSRREICVFFYNESIENVDFRGIPFITR